MKKTLAVLSLSFLSTQASASHFVLKDLVDDYQWTKTFTLASGVKVTHKQDKIMVTDGVKKDTFVMHIFNANGPSIFKSTPSKNGAISVDMSMETFKRELSKVAEITGEDDFDNWTKTFKLENGLEIKHTPEACYIEKDGAIVPVGGHWFNKGPSLHDTTSNGDGFISTEMTLEKFTAELTKWSPIIEVN